MDEHGAPDVCSLQHVDVEGLVGRIEHDLEEGDDDQLEGTGSTQHCPHCDQNCSCCKVTAHQTEGRERKGDLYQVEPLWEGHHWGILNRGVSLIQGLFCTCFYVAGTADDVIYNRA